jgi:uncharacterized delta-60 repeat protein
LAARLPLAGSLDRSFGGGFVTHSFGRGYYSSIEGIAVQPDRKIVVAIDSPRGDLLLARYKPNGSLDPSFGTGGVAEPQLSFYAYPRAVALQSDGKIIVAGVSQPSVPGAFAGGAFILARFNPDGSLDTTFGTQGITNTVIPAPPGTFSDASATAVAVLRGGEILAAGGVGFSGPNIDPLQGPGSFALARYTPDGSLDPTFGDGGIVQTSFIGEDTVVGIAVQPDGKIVASGTGGLWGHGADIETIALARYEPDGSLDPAFGRAGKVTTPTKFSVFGGPTTLDGGPPTLQHGKIVIAASHSGETSSFLVIVRYDGSGRLDSTFGKHGFAKIRGVTAGITHGLRTPSAVFTQHDGKILIAAANSVIRLQPNGQLDPSFGRGGIVSIKDRISTLALQAGRKILVGGGRRHAWTLARLFGGNNCVVPKLRGQTVSKARKTLKASYCRTGRISRLFSNTVAKGHVISTATPPGDRLPDGTKVDLAVSQGKPT